MASLRAQPLEVRSLSASNLPNVRKFKGHRTKIFVVVTGPVPPPYRTSVDEIGGFNPRWDNPFTISLPHEQPDAVLEFGFWISRSVQGDKRIGKAQVPVADFSGPNEESKVYPIECIDQIHGANAQLIISAKLKQDEGVSSSTSSGGRKKPSPTGEEKTAGVPLKRKPSPKLSTKPSSSTAQKPNQGRTSAMKNTIMSAAASGATAAASTVATGLVTLGAGWLLDEAIGDHGDDDGAEDEEDEDDQSDNNDNDGDEDEAKDEEDEDDQRDNNDNDGDDDDEDEDDDDDDDES